MPLRHVLREGAYLAQRWEGKSQVINLYHCDDGDRGFFVEVGLDEVRECPAGLRSFCGSVPLENHT